MAEATINLRQYIGKNKTFLIPDYQRGYIWGKKSGEKNVDSATNILKEILKGFTEQPDSPIFLQGITVTEQEGHDGKITLIDGQQRTTFLYLLLCHLKKAKSLNFRIEYAVRSESDKFLKSLRDCGNLDEASREDPDEKYQDIYYFKKTLRTIREILNGLDADLDTFTEFVLDKIRFLYIRIPAEQATKIFSMMNGSRAGMLQPELIKAEILRLASKRNSLPTASEKEELSREWEIRELRSRYAREWDKWLRWWNNEEVRKVFRTEGRQLGWLLPAVVEKSGKDVSFDEFRRKHLDINAGNYVAARRTFDDLRRTQKHFEDVMRTPHLYNYTGAIIRLFSDTDNLSFVRKFFGVKEMPGEVKFREAYLGAFIGMTFNEIYSRDSVKAEEKALNMLERLKSPQLYVDEAGIDGAAMRLLFRLNIDQDNLQNQGRGRCFDFSIWAKSMGSLEHILPKSKMYHLEGGRPVDTNGEEVKMEDYENTESEILRREDLIPIKRDAQTQEYTIGERSKDSIALTEHCIGNLVLLYTDDNSKFSNRTFNEKKQIFLVGIEEKGSPRLFKSRHLLHTIYSFAENSWGAAEIAKHYCQTLNAFNKTYQNFLKDDAQQN